MPVIFKRDFLAYFRTPVGYVFMGVFLSLSGLIFYLYNLQYLSGDLLTFLSQLTLLVMLLCPLLVMRLLCEDRQKRTDQLVLTSPVSLAGIIAGKMNTDHKDTNIQRGTHKAIMRLRLFLP